MARRVICVLVSAVLLVPARGGFAATEENTFVALANGARRANGQVAYAVAYDLVGIARRQAQRMARAHDIFHNSRLTTEVSSWRAVGENVGVGGSAGDIHQAFMRSASHRSNILDRDFTQIGVGTAYDERGRLYVSEVFRQPVGAAVARPHPSAPAPHRYQSRAVRPAPVRPDPRAALLRRYAAARAVYRTARPHGVVERAETFVRVVHTLV